MPFIDLSTPTNQTGTSATPSNDLSGLPQGSIQPVVTPPTMVDATVENSSTEKEVETPVAPVVEYKPLVKEEQRDNTLPPIDNIVSAKPTTINTEEHILMRNIPQDLTQNPTNQINGVKEFIGPSLESTNNLTNNLNVTASSPNAVHETVIKPATEGAIAQLPTLEKPEVKVDPAVQGTLANEKVTISAETIEKLLDLVVQKEASDLHLAVGFPPTMRFDGALIGIGRYDLTAEDVKTLLSKMLDKRLQDELLRNMDVDFSYTHKSGNRFRVNIFWSKGTMAAAFRYISSKIRSIAELGLPTICFDLIKRPHGLILLTGPTGSGKSTSIAAMIQEINVMEAKHIVTIEDPIEYIFPRAKSIVNQREIGNDASGWKRSLRELLRQDPNVVVVGEMRDYETIASTITVAETGHLVFATLHTNSASQTVDRIIDVFPDAQQPQIRAQLATVINAVVSQRLVPLINGGRKAIFEVMIATPAIKNAIREGKTYQIDNIIQTSIDMGMITLEKSLVQLIRNGEITIETAKEFTNKPEELDSLLKGN
jgi:twitching motility protein PilT